ncbi:fumarylacetoacetate hydrolase family protein [Aquibium sp. ELW1220]|uniref:fumarylacetoacetate hydrolase family protein n=1 Tax=Aquibium sp. ELW1220 TaxID=2976766 RepID=UPI0025B1968A|nr:fumarylacetoacetate hydrolase family protein [Aquibium sp. ELW1220]MDN2580977.1 fumarylacetoacetate hydrolase family protein [Aquibium sp. ELW1220]
MKLATYKDGSRDGQLWIVSRDLSMATPAHGIAPTLRAALEAWDSTAPALRSLAADLDAGRVAGATPFDPARCMAPLPRAPGWLDGSSFLHHGRLMEKAFNAPPIPDFETVPVVYQGGSDDLRGPREPMPFVAEEHQIDMEGEFGLIVGDVPMGTTPEKALDHVRLLVQLNDWSLRKLAPYEMSRGFGWVQAKPSTSFAPVAITPDELGDDWRDGRIQLRLHVAINGREVGRAHGGAAAFSFGRLISHCAATRRLSAGTIIGTGTVSNDDPEAGSSCLSEVRVLEILRDGAPKTPFLSFGDRVQMQARADDGSTPFGALDQEVVRA